MFLIERISHLLLTKRGKRKSAYSFLGWTINGLLTLTLIPIFLNLLGIDDSVGVIKILENRALYLLVLFLISFIELSDAVITSLGRKSNPALMMAVSFMFIIMVGSGMLLMPRCIQQGVHLSWIDSLFTATSPSPLSAYNGFFGSKPFSRTNEFLKGVGEKPIDWQL